MGDYDVRTLVLTESTLEYHPKHVEILTSTHYLGQGQCLVGSLTGAVASQKVTEALKGSLRMVGNHSKSVMV